jgi:hypothetical protein
VRGRLTDAAAGRALVRPTAVNTETSMGAGLLRIAEAILR